MRIALVNWAKIWHGASRGGGINAYTQSLGLALLERGHEVVSIGSGTTPRLHGGRLAEAGDSSGGSSESGGGTCGEGGECHARRHADWRGIRVFEIVHSPVRAPSTFQFDRPEAEQSSPELERVFGELLRAVGPDLAHFQSLEGLSGGCVREAKRGGARVVFSLHNYHTVCPQVYLMQGDTRACMDFENGHACVGCHRPAWKEKGRRVKRSGTRRVRSARDALVPLPVLGEDARGGAVAGGAGEGDEERIAVSNEARGEPASSRAPNAYALRRGAMIEALNACDRVHAVSSFVARKYEALGVDGSRIVTCTLGTPIVEQVRERVEIVAAPERLGVGGRPVRVVFLGYHNKAKGLDLLVEALERSEADVLARLHLCVHALGVGSIAHRLRRLEARMARLTLSDGYEREDIPWLLGGADLGVVPSVWWDNGPQTVMEMLACGVPVLGAELGGIPDFVRDGENGLLFRGNDREDLVRRLGEAVLSEGLLDRLRAGVQPPKSLQAHLAEMVGIYEACLRESGSSPTRRAV